MRARIPRLTALPRDRAARPGTRPPRPRTEALLDRAVGAALESLVSLGVTLFPAGILVLAGAPFLPTWILLAAAAWILARPAVWRRPAPRATPSAPRVLRASGASRS